MKLEKVAVLGAGAVGAYVLWGLSEKPGIRLGVVAEGERARRLQNGIGINGKVYHPEVWTPEEAHGADLLVVALKYGALPGALDSIRQVVGEHTIVMSLMNGVDSEEIIAAEVGADHLLYSLIKVVSHKEADGFRFDPDTTLGIIYGELAAPFESERVRAVAALFEGTGVHFRATEHIREEMWSKFRLNVCNNLPQAILGAGVGCYRDSVHMKAISDGLRKELMAIAAAIAWSRVYLGVHWPLDMVGGLLAGMCGCLGAALIWHTFGPALYHQLQRLYRLCFSLPIRKGWVRG